jgi:phosphotransferase system HPr-like phosphotransfer protein
LARGRELIVTDMSWPRLGATRRRLRARAETTPGRLRLTMAAIVIVALLAGLLVAALTALRSSSADSVATRDEPVMVGAQRLYRALSDADATAATTYLRGGAEPAALRARYLDDLRTASLQIADLGRRVEGSDETAAVASIAGDLPVYSGLIETARANNRQDLPVGAAYVRRASRDYMRNRMLPASRQLYAAEAQRLNDHQHRGTDIDSLIFVVIAFGCLLAVLIQAQIYLAQRTHRVFNVPLVAATVLLVGLSVWTVVGMASARSALLRSQRDGTDSVQILSAAHILALRAQADESLALVARGDGEQYVNDFVQVDDLLQPPSGLLGDAAGLIGSRAALPTLAATWRAIGVEHAQVAQLEHEGNFDAAVQRAVGLHAREAALFDRFNRGLDAPIAAAQRRFDQAAHDARSALTGLAVGIPLMLLVCVALALAGLQNRLNEYR